MMIDPMCESDVTDVHRLVSSSFDWRLRPYMTSAQAGAERFMRAFVDHLELLPDRKYLVARSESGGLLGYADFRLTGQTSSFLSYIAVAPEARGRGIAGAIFDYFEEQHPLVTSMELDVFADNVAAQALYRKRGFSASHSSEWWVRGVPPRGSVPAGWILRNAATAAAWYRSFGFCEYELEYYSSRRKFGQIGATTVRCFSADDFRDEELLQVARAVIPACENVLYIGPYEGGAPISDCMSINRSIRMALTNTNGVGSQ